MTTSYVAMIRNGCESLAIDNGTFLIENHHQYNLSAVYVVIARFSDRFGEKVPQRGACGRFNMKNKQHFGPPFLPRGRPEKRMVFNSSQEISRGVTGNHVEKKRRRSRYERRGKVREKVPKNGSTYANIRKNRGNFVGVSSMSHINDFQYFRGRKERRFKCSQIYILYKF